MLYLSLCGWQKAPYQPSHDHHLQLGLAYLDIKEMHKAKANLLESWSRHPNTPHTNSALAYFFETTHAFKQAEFYHLKAIRLSRGQAIYHNNYGKFLCRCNRYQEAKLNFLKAAKDPNYLNTGLAYENLGLCLLQMKCFEEARLSFKQAVQANPGLQHSWLALAVLHEPGDLITLKYLKQYQTLVLCSDTALLRHVIQFAKEIEKENTARYYMSKLNKN